LFSYTQRSGVRPFGISCLIAGIDEDKVPKLYLSDPSGELSAWKSAAIGKNSEKVMELLEASYEENMSEDKALNLVIDCMLQYVEAGSKNIEVALMRVNEPMQIVEDDRVDKIIAKLEDEKKKKEESTKGNLK
jgi:20S proteasome subunit alpha 4